MSILLDAGPSLNFLAVGQENILIQLAKESSVPLRTAERVDREVRGMANHPRFERTRVLRTWSTLTADGHIDLLDDDLETPELTDAVSRVSGVAAKDRIRDRRSLGEIMVLAHASVLAQQGVAVTVLIDDADGRARCRSEAMWLKNNRHEALLQMRSTPQVLMTASTRTGWIKKGLSWEQVYDQMRQYDDGLVPRDRFPSSPTVSAR